MSRKIFTLFILVVLLGNFSGFAQINSAKHEGENKRRIVEIGTNQNVKLQLQSGEALEGRISEIKNDLFVLQFVDQNGQVQTHDLRYGDVQKISQKGNQTAGNTFKRGVLKGAGIYVGMVIVGGILYGIAAAASR